MENAAACGQSAPPERMLFPERIGQAWLLAFLITAAQVVLACVLSGEARPLAAYRHLLQWDSNWYGDVAEHGYHCPPRLEPANFGNVAFFPGYPLAVRYFCRATRLSRETALLLVAQAAAAVFWAYLLLILRSWCVPRALTITGIVAILAHPAAFFLVTGYSESLYLAALVGFIYWAERRAVAAPLVALHGFIMTATRLVGLPLVIYPLFRNWLARHRGRIGFTDWQALAVGGVAALGSVLFFVYCAWHFGQWDLYQKTEAAGWNVHPDYLGPLCYRVFCVHWPRFHDGWDVEWLSRVSVPCSYLFLLGLIFAEWRTARLPGVDWRTRGGLYAGAALLIYIPAAGHYSRHFSSMLRFTLCPHVLMVLTALHLATEAGPTRLELGRRARIAIVSAGAVGFAIEIGLLHRFTHGGWVA